jgi:hypothetical protein
MVSLSPSRSLARLTHGVHKQFNTDTGYDASACSIGVTIFEDRLPPSLSIAQMQAVDALRFHPLAQGCH